MIKSFFATNLTFLLVIFSVYAKFENLNAQEIPANTWVRVADCPGDEIGREVAPNRGATWAYCPPLKGFVRYGGYTPRFSNALDLFDPLTKKWTRIWGEDENYPETRPGGGMAWMVQWDESKKLMFIGGGRATSYTGSRGIYSFDPATFAFKAITTELPKGAISLAYDAKTETFVASPGSKSDIPNTTWVYSLKVGKWEKKATNPCPQDTWLGGYPLVYHEAIGRVMAVGNFEKKICVWSFDSVNFKWEKLTAENGPTGRNLFTVAYDPIQKIIITYGVSPDGRSPNQLNDTWAFDPATLEWKEIATPGPTMLKNTDNGFNGRNELVFCSALSFDPLNKRMVMADPDLGVWAIRYDPKEPMGKDSQNNGYIPKLLAAIKNPPAKPAENREVEAKEIRLTLPSPLNKRIVDMPDNSMIALGAGQKLHGHEIGWTYDSDAGVFIKYGGCGNGSNPYWQGYSNSLLIFDPGTERVYTRRVADIAGANRPSTGCTRSVTYDAVQKVTWFFGGVGSGPYCGGTYSSSYSYDIAKDLFIGNSQKWPGELGNPGCFVQYSPDHDLAFYFRTNIAWMFNGKTPEWNKKPTTSGPAANGQVYGRIAYIKSKKLFFVLGISGQIADAKKDIPDTLANQTYTFDPVTLAWNDLKAENQPPARQSKFGLAYDSKNDVILLIGGGTSWNFGLRKDMWIYHVKENKWEEIKPTPTDGLKEVIQFDDGMQCDYDSRHNAFLIVGNSGNGVFAYRYKK